MDLLTVKQTQEKLQLSHNTMYKLLHTADFPTIRIGRKILIPEDSLNQWIKENTNHQIII